jgi:hypothetical protein
MQRADGLLPESGVAPGDLLGGCPGEASDGDVGVLLRGELALPGEERRLAGARRPVGAV